jgi:hypothetical protein
MRFVISRVKSVESPYPGAVPFDYTMDFSPTYSEQRRGWYINIDTLDELLLLQQECGDEIIIGDWYVDTSQKEITIYDGYIE